MIRFLKVQIEKYIRKRKCSQIFANSIVGAEHLICKHHLKPRFLYTLKIHEYESETDYYYVLRCDFCKTRISQYIHNINVRSPIKIINKQ